MVVDTASHLTRRTLAQAVDEVEASLFTGRRRELTILRQGLESARRGAATALYVHGPAGVGKSALVREHARWTRAHGSLALALPPAAARSGRRAVLDALAAQVEEGASGAYEVDALVERLNSLGAEYGLVLTADMYEPFMAEDDWLRHELFLRLGPGVSLVLVGRRPPYHLWPTQESWRRVLQAIPLKGLEVADGSRLLARMDVRADLAREVQSIARGNPAAIVVAARAIHFFGDIEGPGSGAEPGASPSHHVASLVAEHLLHPGSRRANWRAPTAAASLDHLLAAASFLPHLDRTALEAVVGYPVGQDEWNTLVDLPLFAETPWGHHIPNPARHALMSVVAAQKPWLVRWWLLRAAAHYLESAQSRDAAGTSWPLAWFAVAPLAADMFTPTDATALACGSDTASPEWLAAALEQCPVRRPAAPSESGQSTRAAIPYVMLGATGSGEVVVRWATGGCANCPLYAVAARDQRDELLAEPGLLQYIEALSPAARPTHIGVCQAGACCWAGGLRALLCAHLDMGRSPTLRMAWSAHDPERADLLGFRPASEPDDGGGQPPLYVLDFASLDEAAWLETVLSHARRASPAVQEQVAYTAEALGALDDPARLVASGAANWARDVLGVARSPDVRQWIVDALEVLGRHDEGRSAISFLSAEFPALAGIGGGETQEEPSGAAARRTYYRHRRNALLALAGVLFA